MRDFMKRRRADRSDWERIVKRRYVQQHIDSDEFSGYIGLLCLDHVPDPFWVSTQGDFCIADDGYAWLHQFPQDAFYVVTTMFDAHGNVIQWYIDICAKHGLDDDGVPWFEDLYLDIVIMPSGKVMLLDEDELDEALEKGQVSRSKYDIARYEAERLMSKIEAGQFSILGLSTSHRDLLLAQI